MIDDACLYLLYTDDDYDNNVDYDDDTDEAVSQTNDEASLQ